MSDSFFHILRSGLGSIWVAIGLMAIAGCAGWAAPLAHAEERAAQIAPIRLTLPPIDVLGPILDVNLLPDGRFAIIGYARDSKDTYIRVYDPRTGSDERYEVPLEAGLQPVEGMDRSVAIAGGSLFVYGIKARLLRAPRRVGAGASSPAQTAESPAGLIRLRGFDLSGIERSSGAMAADGDSILVGWWEGAYAKRDRGDCGDGAMVARVASDGRELWRWRDPRGGLGSPDDMIALADGTILALVDRGYVRGGLEGMSRQCFDRATEIVALAPDGQETSRLDLSPFLCIGPLSLSADGREAIAIAQTSDAPYAILRFGIDGGQIQLGRLDLPEKIPDIGCRDTVATTTAGGDYRIVSAAGGLLVLDEAGRRLEWSPFPGEPDMTCRGHGDQGVICWKENKIATLPLTAAAPPQPVSWQFRALASTASTGAAPVIQHVERLPDGRLVVMSQTDRSEFVSLQIFGSNGSLTFSSVLGAGSPDWPNHAVAGVKDAVFVSKPYGDLWRLSSNGQQDRKLDPLGTDRPVLWDGVLPAGDGVDAMGWEDGDEQELCGRGARVAHLSLDGKPDWIWQDTQAGIRFPTDMISMGGGSLLVLLDGQPPSDLVGLIGEETLPCYEGGRAYLALIALDGAEIDRMVLPEGFKLGPLSRNGDGGAAAIALQKGIDPDLIVTIQTQDNRIVMNRVAIRMPLPVTKDTAIVTGTPDGYRLLLRSHILAVDPDGHLIVKQRRVNVPGRCEMVASQGDFCWTAEKILFQSLQ